MVKIVTIALICGIIIIYLKSINSEFTLLATICASVVLLFFAYEYLQDIYTFINDLIDLTGINKNLYVIIFKIVAIGYLVEFGGQTLSDFGLESIASKLYFIGKLAILSVSLPIIYAIYNLLTGLLQ
jgi:stage III sporulation protein AD